MCNIIYIYDNNAVIQLSYVCPAGEEDEDWGAPEAKYSREENLPSKHRKFIYKSEHIAPLFKL